MMGKSLDLLFADVLSQQSESQSALPPVEKWNPPLSGDMDLRIAADGCWYHEGAPIQREALVKLFSTVLKREGDEYFLVTPVEKWRIQVEDVPFLVTTVERIEREGQQALLFRCATGDEVVAGAENPIRVVVDEITGEPAPYILVRSGIEGRINRPVFYELVSHAEKKEAVHGVYSLGVFFPLE